MEKSKKKNYGDYILNNKESILKRKRKIKNIKRGIVIFIILTAVLITLSLNLEYFNIDSVNIKGTMTINEEAIRASSNIALNTNIFKVRLKDVRANILENPYIESVNVKRKLPSNITIDVKERKAAFYIEYGGAFYIVDDKGIVLEKRDNIDNMRVLKLEGVENIQLEVGKGIIMDNKEKFQYLCNIYDYLYDNEYIKQYNFVGVQLNEFIDIKLFTDKFYIKLGTTENIIGKLDKAFSILKEPQFSSLQGYIDVSFNGNPVVHMTKKEG